MGGGPTPKGFVDYFNGKYSKNKFATQRTFYPTIDLLIQTDDYGKLIIGFSIKDRSWKLYNWGSLKTNSSEVYDTDVLAHIDKFAKTHLKGKSLDDVASYLKLDIKNKVEWKWTNDIKILEGLFDNHTSGLYEALTKEEFIEFKKSHKISHITSSDILEISKIFKVGYDDIKSDMNLMLFEYSGFLDCIYRLNSYNGHELTAYKFEDDWWIIKSGKIHYFYYICDSFEGLKELVNKK